MRNLFTKAKGGHPRAPLAHWRHALISGGCSFLAIGLLAWLNEFGVHPWVLGSFGASCVLLFGYPDSPFSQPRHLILGHTMSSLVGLAALALLGVHWWSLGLAVAVAIVLMMKTGVMHPPAGSNPLIVMMLKPSWLFALMPSLAGALVLVLLGVLLVNLQPDKHYPKYW